MTPREAVLELKARISRSIAAASTARSPAVSRRGPSHCLSVLPVLPRRLAGPRPESSGETRRVLESD